MQKLPAVGKFHDDDPPQPFRGEDSTSQHGNRPPQCNISTRLMPAWGHFSPLPRRSIAVCFTPVSGIDSRSQALPGRADFVAKVVFHRDQSFF
jgi:hypothetical protein